MTFNWVVVRAPFADVLLDCRNRCTGTGTVAGRRVVASS